MMRAALIQMTGSDDPAANLALVSSYIRQAVAQGAEWVLTPEVTNCISASRTRQIEVLETEAHDTTLPALTALAAELGVWLLIGSLAIKTDDPDGRFANRSYLVDPFGEIVARYDKIHMFDVDVSDTETYRESAGYRPGTRAQLATTPWGVVGMTVCYDLRFPHLYRALGQGGASFLTVPSAFSPVTGAAHWEALLRARAIETGCFVLAPAQTGQHPASRGRSRATYGHSMIVAPWGEVVLDAGTQPGVFLYDLDPEAVAQARARVPSITAASVFTGPEM
jgi:predicted amidohydrolase